MEQWATDGDRYHWAATQYLCLCAVLEDKQDPATMIFCRRIANRDVESPDQKLRAWALGTLAELALLRSWHEGPYTSKAPELAWEEDREKITKEVVRHCREIVRLSGKDSFEVTSTRRQFQRYVDRWHLGAEWKHEDWTQIAKDAVEALTP